MLWRVPPVKPPPLPPPPPPPSPPPPPPLPPPSPSPPPPFLPFLCDTLFPPVLSWGARLPRRRAQAFTITAHRFFQVFNKATRLQTTQARMPWLVCRVSTVLRITDCLNAACRLCVVCYCRVQVVVVQCLCLQSEGGMICNSAVHVDARWLELLHGELCLAKLCYNWRSLPSALPFLQHGNNQSRGRLFDRQKTGLLVLPHTHDHKNQLTHVRHTMDPVNVVETDSDFL